MITLVTNQGFLFSGTASDLLTWLQSVPEQMSLRDFVHYSLQ